jgi:hypothetical protein
VAWYLVSDRPAWQTWPLVGLVSGLALLLGESFGGAFCRSNTECAKLASWQVFLAGVAVPLAMLVAIRLGRVRETVAGFLVPGPS